MRLATGILFSALCLAVLRGAAGASAGWSFPLYKQCDARWASDEMGVQGPGERATICKEGCAMTSVTMALAGLGVDVSGATPTPATMNSWLEANKGYECIDGDCNNLVLDAVDAGTLPNSVLHLIGEVDPPSYASAMAHLAAQDRIYLLHVHDGGHFVLATGSAGEASEELVAVNDPFYSSTEYPWANVSDVIAYSLSPLAPHVPFEEPLFKQCDPRWGNDKIDTDTICQVGCLMSSTSMALNGHGIQIPDGSGKVASDPGTLNTWLRNNHGYDENDLIESAVPNIAPDHITWNETWSMHRTNDLSLDEVHKYVDGDYALIANVMQGHHFVLVIGWDTNDQDTLLVNDPGFNRPSYSYKEDVVGWRIFGMKKA